MSEPGRHLHFAPAEYLARRAAATAELNRRGLSALLVFRQESLYYLTGFDTFGYVYFQALVLTADGRMTLLTRAPDVRQARFTSVIEDVRVWVDGAAARPEIDLKVILTDLGLRGQRVGVEFDAYGLTARLGHRLARALTGLVKIEDASDLVSLQRLVKSPAEIAYVRKAAELADAALAAAVELAHPGAFEGDILAAMHGAVFRGGGDDPANEFIIGSGLGGDAVRPTGAMLCRYYSGRRHLDPVDQLTLEFAGTYRHYHSCLMRTIPVGKIAPRQQELHKAASDALQACEAALKPGATFGTVFAAHAETLDAAGLSQFRLNACGYSLGAVFAPNWMDWPMVYEANPVIVAPGQVVFLHMIIFDDDTGFAMTLGRTSLVTETGVEVLSKAPLELTAG